MDHPVASAILRPSPGKFHQETGKDDKPSDTKELLVLDHGIQETEKGHTTSEDDDDPDSVIEDISSPSEEDHPSRILTQRRIEDNFYFSQWVKDKHTEIVRSAPAQALGDENRSVAWIVRQAESEKIINTPREYQVELFEKAKEKNIIAVLDTGVYRNWLVFDVADSGTIQERERRWLLPFSFVIPLVRS